MLQKSAANWKYFYQTREPSFKEYERTGHITCRHHGKVSDVRIIKRKNGTVVSCRECLKIKERETAALMKRKAVEYLGGKCQDCGIEGPPCIYDFHHRDPSQKDFHLSSNMSRTWERIKTELDKCMLLCSNCHRILHWLEKDLGHRKRTKS